MTVSCWSACILPETTNGSNVAASVTSVTFEPLRSIPLLSMKPEIQCEVTAG